MSETPLFEVIPPRHKTYDELVELVHYLNRRSSLAEERLYELTLIIRDGAEDRNDTPAGAWLTAIEQLDQWDHEDGYEWDWSEHEKTPVEMYYPRDDQ